MCLCPLLHGQINFIDLEEETAKPSWCHSYRSSFKRQVIALPSHGQNTAAVKPIVTGQAGPLMFWFARGDVFGKQARLVFAEFLLFLWVFPLGHSCVGVTICWCRFFLVFVLAYSSLLVWVRYLSVGGPVRLTHVLGESCTLLLLILA